MLYKQFTSLEKKTLLLAGMGGMLEVYDFIIYGIFALYFAQLFFPHGNYLLSIIQTYILFILGYVVRPLGGMFFSHIGDEYGRKKVLIVTIILMGSASLGIFILPTYNTIGIAAPILLLLLRLLQGFALGGELPSAYVYVYESVAHDLGICFGIIMSMVNLGLLCGIAVNYVITTLLSHSQIIAYGWRIPFLLGGILCVVSYKIRQSLQETTSFTQNTTKLKLPIIIVFTKYLKELLIGIALSSSMAMLGTLFFIFMPTYLTSIAHINYKTVSGVMLIAISINVIAIVVTGLMCQYISAKRLFILMLILTIIMVPISYKLISINYLVLGIILMSVIQGMAAMLTPLLITAIYPTAIRLTGVAMSYNMAFTLFGGSAPIIISSMINHGYNIYLVPVIYIVGVTLLITATGVYFLLQQQSYE